MTTKIIILKKGFLPDKAAFAEKGKTYILTTEQETIPVSILGIIKGEFEIVLAGDGSQEAYAFYLGQLYAQNKGAKLFTDDERLTTLFEGNVKAEKPVKKTKTNNAAEVNKTADTIKVKENEIAPAKRGRKPRTKTNHEPAQGSADFASVSTQDIEKLLKKNSYDTKYAPVIMEALKTANKVTADIMVRTKLSLIEEDKEIIAKLGELIKNTYC